MKHSCGSCENENPGDKLATTEGDLLIQYEFFSCLYCFTQYHPPSIVLCACVFSLWVSTQKNEG